MSTVLLKPRLDAESLARHLDGLMGRDARLVGVRERAGAFEVRTNPSGFPGLARVICGQQLSVASARAIWTRFAALEGAETPEGFLALAEARVRGAGMSAGKYRTISVLAQAVVEEQLDFGEIDVLPAPEAIASLTALKGIGPWTAEIYLMFCAGHPDIFPAGDLALQKAVAHGLGLARRCGPKELAVMAELWAPHRATAALLFWRYFAAIREREGIAL